MKMDMAITTTGLTRRFGALTAVETLDLDVPQGSVYGFLGPNGAGKTTTIRMLLGLLRPTDGDVRILGKSLQLQRQDILRQVGALVESPSLYSHLTGRENLELTRRLVGGTQAQIDRALKIARLTKAADRLVKTYSLGMQQRLGLALALLREPELLILDEPTNGLDPAGIREMRDLICRLPEEQGITIFLSSHLLSEVEQMATHIGIINQGRLLFQGPKDALQAQVSDYLALECDQPQQAKRVLAQTGWTIQSNGQRRLVITANGYADAAMINSQLVQQGISVYHLKLEHPTLEDIFFSLTDVEGVAMSGVPR